MSWSSGSSWLFPYMNNFVRLDQVCVNYLTNKKDSRVWIGIVEAICAFAYMRFRPGGKFRLQKGFRITNDHSHPVKIGDYKFNVQGTKRWFLGGSSDDILNFTNPIFYSYLILKELRPENREVFLRLALESTNNLIETYDKDLSARKELLNIRKIIETQLEDGDLDLLKEFFHIDEDYLESPLTKKNLEIWMEDIDILNKIADLFRRACQALLDGRNYEPHLAEIRDYSEEARYKLESFLMEIPKGHS